MGKDNKLVQCLRWLNSCIPIICYQSKMKENVFPIFLFCGNTLPNGEKLLKLFLENKIYTFPGLLLCGPENVAIIRIRFVAVLGSSIWTCVLLASGASLPIVNFFHGVRAQSHYDGYKSNSAAMLHLFFTTLALLNNIAMKIYSDHLHRSMTKLHSIFVIFGGNTEDAVPQEEKFSFSLSSAVVFPAIVLLTIWTSYGSRHIRLLLFFPIQIFFGSIVLPCCIIFNNSKIKRLASNQVSKMFETLESFWRSLRKLRSRQVSPKNGSSIRTEISSV